MNAFIKNGLRMKIAIVLAALLLMICAFAWKHYQIPNSCEELRARINDPEVVRYLIAWVDQNVAGRNDLAEIISPTTGGPGVAQIKIPFEWRKLGLREHFARIELVKESGYYSAYDGGRYVAVYFGEGGRRGVIVNLGAGEFLGPNVTQWIRERHGRVALYCNPGD
jgi:hypothetical protein